MKKSTLIALGTFAVLLVIVLATREEHVNVGVPKLTLPVVDANGIVALDVSGVNQAKLTFENGTWSVASPSAPEKRFAADESQVKNALTQLSELRATDFVTANPAKHPELEIDETKGLKVKATGSGLALELILGKPAKSGGTYVRLAASNEVFTTPSGAAYALKKNVNGWRKKAITTAALANVQSVTFAPIGGGGFTITQGEGENAGWVLRAHPASFRFDPAAAARVAQTLTSLSAQDFADDVPAFEQSHEQAVLTLKDGTAVTLHFGTKRPDGTVPLRVDADPQVYLLSGYVFDQLPKTLEQLRDTTLFSFATEKVNRVTVSAAGKKTVLSRDGASWKVVEPKVAPPEFDATQVPVFLGRLQSLRAVKVAEASVTAAQAGLSKATTTVELAIDGAKPQAVRFGGEATDGVKQVYVQGSTDALIYLIASAEKARFDSGIGLFNKPAPPPQNMGQMQGLESLPPDIRAKLEAQLRQQGMR